MEQQKDVLLYDKTYSREEAFEASLTYFGGDELAANVWINKYCLKDADGNLYESSPRDMHERIARELHRIECNYDNPMSYEDIFDLLDGFRYIVPQGSPMAGIGNDKQIISISNCFVVGNPPGMEDSYGAIMKIDERIAQLQKRRCVSENTNVWVRGRGLIKIKDVQIGDYIYSFNLENNKQEFNKVLNKFETFVKKENRLTYKTKNGTVLETSTLHPILIDNDNGYNWVKDADLNANSIRPISNSDFTVENSDDVYGATAAWFAGAHLGDGSADYKLAADKTLTTRLRMTGDNKKVIDFYCHAINVLGGSNAKAKRSTRKDYITEYWSVECRSKLNSKLIEKYLDNIYGNKTYFSSVPLFVQKNVNEYFIPFLAGIIDTDGHIDHTGRISITLANKNLIDQLCSILSLFGIRYTFKKRKFKAKNASTAYKLTISNQLNIQICKYLKHDVKKAILTAKPIDVKEYSTKFHLHTNEYNDILLAYSKLDSDKIGSNLRSCINHLIKSNDKGLGIGFINELIKNSLITEDVKNRIIRRQQITEKLDYTESTKFIDIEVENVNNFYAGNFGLILIHNCGVGTDISGIRPDGSAVNNAAITSTGIVPFMERYSNTTREVAQGGRRGALMISVSIRHPESEKFIDAKMDTTKVTGANVSVKIHDDFMEAMLANKDYRFQWPIESDTPKFVRTDSAKKLWNKIIHNAWKSAEPGVLFWDNIVRESPADIYEALGFNTVSTNPCVTGDTLVAVADGRGYVPIKQLVDEGNDVPVYTLDNKHKIVIRKMVNPRLTGNKVRTYKVTLDDGSVFKVTGNHQFLMRDKTYKKCEDLINGDSLFICKKEELSIKDVFPNANSKSQNYNWLSTCETKSMPKSEHRLIYEYHNGKIEKNNVIHHKDYDAK